MATLTGRHSRMDRSGLFVPNTWVDTRLPDGQVIRPYKKTFTHLALKTITKWTILRSEMVLDHRWYKVRRDEVQLPNGKILDDYFVSVRPEVVLVFPVTADNHVIMVRQYKHGAQEILLELPGGIVDDTDTSYEEAVLRELREETGYSTSSVTRLGMLHDDPTKNTNCFHLFLAQHVELTDTQKLDHTEDIQVEKIPLADLKKMVVRGEIKVANSLALILLALEKLSESGANGLTE